MDKLSEYKIKNEFKHNGVSLTRQKEIEKLIHSIRSTRDGERTFFDTKDFPWVSQVEKHWIDIRRELDSLLNAIESLPAFQEIQPEQSDISNNADWKIFPLCAYGWWPESSAARCPITVEVLKNIPGIKAGMFSIFKSGKIVPPHFGPYCGVLRYHLGVKIPNNYELCGIRVGKDTKFWREGKSLIFDDTHDHEAWNHSDDVRVVLFIDFERPLYDELDSMNQEAISTIKNSNFITDVVKQYEEWDEKYGHEIDNILRTQSSQ